MNKKLGPLYILLGASSYAFAGIILELSKTKGYFLDQIIVSIYFFSFIILLFLCLFNQKKFLKLNKKESITYFSFGLFNIMITYSFYKTLKYCSVPFATLLLIQSSWITPLLACVFKKNKLLFNEIVSMLTIVLGVFIASYIPHTKNFVYIQGIVWGITAAVSYSLMLLCSGSIFEKAFYSAFGAFFSLVLFKIDIHISIWAISYALLAIVIPLILFSLGIANTPPNLAGILITFELPIAYAASYIVYDTAINFFQIIGCFFIILATILPKIISKYFK